MQLEHAHLPARERARHLQVDWLEDEREPDAPLAEPAREREPGQRAAGGAKHVGKADGRDAQHRVGLPHARFAHTEVDPGCGPVADEALAAGVEEGLGAEPLGPRLVHGLIVEHHLHVRGRRMRFLLALVLWQLRRAQRVAVAAMRRSAVVQAAGRRAHLHVVHRMDVECQDAAAARRRCRCIGHLAAGLRDGDKAGDTLAALAALADRIVVHREAEPHGDPVVRREELAIPQPLLGRLVLFGVLSDRVGNACMLLALSVADLAPVPIVSQTEREIPTTLGPGAHRDERLAECLEQRGRLLGRLLLTALGALAQRAEAHLDAAERIVCREPVGVQHREA